MHSNRSRLMTIAQRTAIDQMDRLAFRMELERREHDEWEAEHRTRVVEQMMEDGPQEPTKISSEPAPF